MIHLDSCCSASTQNVEHAGVLRPRFFTIVTVKCEKSKMSFSRAVLIAPFLFRVRLKMAARKMARAARKYRKFAERNALLPRL